MNREIAPVAGRQVSDLILEPPPWLDKIAKEHWLYFAPILSMRRLLTEADISLLAAASERWSVYRRAAVLMKGSVRGKKMTGAERLKLAEQAARETLTEHDANLADFLGMPLERTRGKLKRGHAPEGNEIPAEPILKLDPKLLGEYTVPPQHTIASQALQDYLTIMREFGVGPATRERMKVETESPEDGNSDKIAELRDRRAHRASNLDEAPS